VSTDRQTDRQTDIEVLDQDPNLSTPQCQSRVPASPTKIVISCFIPKSIFPSITIWVNLLRYFCGLIFKQLAEFNSYLTPHDTPFTAVSKYANSYVNPCYCSSTNRDKLYPFLQYKCCSNPEASPKLEILRAPSISIDFYRSFLY
jgi:hypothetical protein